MNAENRRIILNPEPLKMVETRVGSGGAKPELVVCRLVRGDKGMIAMSVHKDYCPRAPEDGKTRADGATWSVTAATRVEMDDAVVVAELAGVEPAVWCRTCRGWGVA